MNKRLLALTTCILLSTTFSFAEEHEHGHEGEHGHEQEEPHGHSEVSAAVGKEKGILEADEAKGFKLSPEALKNFSIQTIPATTAPTKVSRSSIFFGLEEKNLYRVRDGYFKRIDFKTLSKSKTEYTVTSVDLKEGDRIAVTGLGFLRVSELAAFGGVAEGHSH
jgi:hypothetical protein